MVQGMGIHEAVAPRAPLSHILKKLSSSLATSHYSHPSSMHHPKVIER